MVDRVDCWYVGLKWERDLFRDWTLFAKRPRLSSLFVEDFSPFKATKRVMQTRRGGHLSLKLGINLFYAYLLSVEFYGSGKIRSYHRILLGFLKCWNEWVR